MIVAVEIGVEGCCSAFSIGDEPKIEPPIGLLFVFCSVMAKDCRMIDWLLVATYPIIEGSHDWRVLRATCAPLVNRRNILSHYGISTTKSSIP